MSDAPPDRIPKTQASAAGSGPPRPPKKTARDVGDGSPDGNRIEIPDPISVKDLAAALGVKPFEVISDAMELNLFLSARTEVGFEISSQIARKRGFDPHKAG
jgi:hypothetical protein